MTNDWFTTIEVLISLISYEVNLIFEEKLIFELDLPMIEFI